MKFRLLNKMVVYTWLVDLSDIILTLTLLKWFVKLYFTFTNSKTSNRLIECVMIDWDFLDYTGENRFVHFHGLFEFTTLNQINGVKVIPIRFNIWMCHEVVFKIVSDYGKDHMPISNQLLLNSLLVDWVWSLRTVVAAYCGRDVPN